MQLTITTANIEYGGINRRDGDNQSALVTLERLLAEKPDILGVQEMHSLDPGDIRRQVRWWANELDMYPFLGASASIRSKVSIYTAIFVRTASGILVTDEWPGPAGAQHPFCRVEADIPGLTRPVHFTSAHLSARSIIRRRESAEIIGSYAADAIGDGSHVLVVGDFNGYPRFGADITLMPPRLRSNRAVRGPEGGWLPEFSADDALTAGGLEDLAARLADGNPGSDFAAPTGEGGARVDRIYADSALAAYATDYRRVPTGSDHDAVSVVFDLPRLLT